MTTSRVDAVYGDLDYVAQGRHEPGDPSLAVGSIFPGIAAPRLDAAAPDAVPAAAGDRALGRFRRSSYRIAADYDAILRYFGRGCIRPAYVPRVLVKMRVGGESNRSVARILRKSKEDYAALRRNQVGGLVTLVWKNVSKLGQFLP